MTRGDKIRSMTDEELAQMLYEAKDCCYCVHSGLDCTDNMCQDGIRQWVEAQQDDV